MAAAVLGIAGIRNVYRLDCGYDWGGRLNAHRQVASP
jgi:hypothetical protein